MPQIVRKELEEQKVKIVVSLLAVLAMIGIASAWDTTEQLQYAYQKTVDTQAGQNLDWLNKACSSAEFSSPTAYGTSNAYLSNSVLSLVAPLQNINGNAPDTQNSITQQGAAIFTTSAPNLENPTDSQFEGQASASTDMRLSGNYGGCPGRDVYAVFDQQAQIGNNDMYVQGVSNGPVSSSNDWPVGENAPSSVSIEADGGYIVVADLGQSTTVGYQQINDPGASTTMSGGSSMWAGFSGAYGLDGAMPTDIETHVSSEASFGTFSG